MTDKAFNLFDKCAARCVERGDSKCTHPTAYKICSGC